jgi:hypothetical protein
MLAFHQDSPQGVSLIGSFLETFFDIFFPLWFGKVTIYDPRFFFNASEKSHIQFRKTPSNSLGIASIPLPLLSFLPPTLSLLIHDLANSYALPTITAGTLGGEEEKADYNRECLSLYVADLETLLLRYLQEAESRSRNESGRDIPQARSDLFGEQNIERVHFISATQTVDDV